MGCVSGLSTKTCLQLELSHVLLLVVRAVFHQATRPKPQQEEGCMGPRTPKTYPQFEFSPVLLLAASASEAGLWSFAV